MNKGNELTTRPDAGGALSRSDQQRSIAEVQASMLLARANPRDENNAIQRIQNECDRPGLAQLAVYQYARGGTDISGPSIRLAEAIARHWGNLHYGLRELERRVTRLGDLDTRIAWLQPTTVDDGVGGQTVTWATESYAWAEVVPAAGASR